MARIRRYDLYEGDGEVIGEEESWSRPSALPGKQPLGRDEELRERDAAEDEAEIVPAADETEPEPEAAAAPDGAEAEADGSDDTVYIVLPGDCLWNIAGSVYGDAARWTDIYRANSGAISDPALIYPGQGLTIPAA